MCWKNEPTIPMVSLYSIPLAINSSLTDTHFIASPCPQTRTIADQGLVTNQRQRQLVSIVRLSLSPLLFACNLFLTHSKPLSLSFLCLIINSNARK